MATTLLPVSADRREVHQPYIALAILQVIDVVTTGFILHHWAIRAEGNPVVARLFDDVGLEVGLASVLAFKLAVVYTFWICQTGARIAVAIYSLVVFNNLLFLFLWLTQGST